MKDNKVFKYFCISCKFFECRYIEKWEDNYKSIAICNKFDFELTGNNNNTCYRCKELK